MVRFVRNRIAAAAALTAMVVASVGLTQPVATPAPRGPGSPSADTRPEGPVTPAAFKEQLLRRIEFSQSIQKRLQEGLDKLNAGGDPTEVRRMLEVQLGRGVLDGGRSRTRGDQPGPGGPDGHAGDGADSQTGPVEGGGRHGVPLSTEERERIRAVLARTRPALLQSIESARASNPALADRTFNAVSGRLRGLDELEKTNPALFELRLDETENGLAIMRQTKALFEARKSADAAALQRERAAMHDLLVRQFDLRARSQTLQIEQLDKKVVQMKAELSEAASRREGTVERRLSEMLERSDQSKGRRPKADSKP